MKNILSIVGICALMLSTSALATKVFYCPQTILCDNNNDTKTVTCHYDTNLWRSNNCWSNQCPQNTYTFDGVINRGNGLLCTYISNGGSGADFNLQPTSPIYPFKDKNIPNSWNSDNECLVMTANSCPVMHTPS